MRHIRPVVMTLMVVAAPAAAQQKLPLDHAAYEEWRTIDDAALSRSLSLLPLLLCPPAALLLGWGLRYYRRALAHVDASAETGV